MTLIVASTADGTVGGTVPATLSLTLGTPATFGAFTPGVARDYSASTTANVISTAADATLSVADPSPTATGKLVNGTFSLPQPLQASGGGPFAPVGGSANPTTLKTWSNPVSNDAVALAFKQDDRRHRRAAHRHLQQDADVHAVHHYAVTVDARRPPRHRGGRRLRTAPLDARTALLRSVR